MFLELGLEPDVAIVTPVYLRGEEKRLTELSFREARPHLIATGSVTADEAAALAGELHAVASDPSIAIAQIRAFQVWARKTFIN